MKIKYQEQLNGFKIQHSITHTICMCCNREFKLLSV